MHVYTLCKVSKQPELVGKVWECCLGCLLLGKKQVDWETPPDPEVGLWKRESEPAAVSAGGMLVRQEPHLAALLLVTFHFAAWHCSRPAATRVLNKQKRLNFLLSGLSMLLTNSSRLTFKWEKLGFEASEDPCPIASRSLALFTEARLKCAANHNRGWKILCSIKPAGEAYPDLLSEDTEALDASLWEGRGCWLLVLL